MSMEFEKIDDKTLANFDLQIVVESGEINFELGGTQFVNVFFDPELTYENAWIAFEYKAEELKKVTCNEDIIAELSGKKKKIFFRSNKRKQLARLSFSSRQVGNTFEWVSSYSSRRRDEMHQMLQTISLKQEDRTHLLSSIFSSIDQLSCWYQINHTTVERVRIIVEGDLSSLRELENETAVVQSTIDKRYEIVIDDTATLQT